jgi:hypothetical protein
MSKTQKSGTFLRPTGEDLLRALGYAVIMVWAALFYFFPPTAFVSSLDVLTRTLWMGITFLGAFVAFVGSITRIDLKLEFPGLLFAQIGPLLYFLSQIYYVMNPGPGDLPNSRVALIAYAILPGVLLLPRTCSLMVAAFRLRKINRNNEDMKTQLARAQRNLSGEVRTRKGAK